VVDPDELAAIEPRIADTHEGRLPRHGVLREHGSIVEAQRVELWIAHQVVTGEVVEGQEVTVVDLHLVAGQHVVESEQVGLACSVAVQDVIGVGSAVEPPAGRGAREHGDARAESVARLPEAFELDHHRQ
jgi:hypothetical protein